MTKELASVPLKYALGVPSMTRSVLPLFEIVNVSVADAISMVVVPKEWVPPEAMSPVPFATEMSGLGGAVPVPETLMV